MTARIQHRRALTAGAALPNLPMLAGELALNLPDGQLFTTTGGTPTPLIGVRPFASTAKYVANDIVANAGSLLVAKAAVGPKAFDPADWTSVAGTGATTMLADGSATAPALAFSADPDTGLFRKTTDTLAWATAGVERWALSTIYMTLAQGMAFIMASATAGTQASIAGNATGGLIARSTALTGASLIDLITDSQDGTSAASVRVFRSTTTTGARNFYLYRGDGSATLDHVFTSDAAPNLAAQISRMGGRTLIGTTTDNAIDTLQVGGTARVRTGASGTIGNANYDDFVLELAGSGGMNISSPASSLVGLVFCRPSFVSAGGLIYDHSTDIAQLYAGSAARMHWAPTYVRALVPLLGADDTAAAPGFSWITDPDTGMFHVGANVLGFATQGAEKVRINATNSAAELLVGQAAAAAWTATGRGLVEINGSTEALLGLDIAGAKVAYLQGASSSVSLGTFGARGLAFVTNSIEAGRFTPNAWGEFLVNTNSVGTYSLSNRGLIRLDGTAGALLGLDFNGTRCGYLISRGTAGAPTDLLLSSGASVALLFGYNNTEVARIDIDLTMHYTPGASAPADPTEVGFRQVPQVINPSGAYQMKLSDRGKCIVQQAQANVVTFGGFSAGDVVSIFNASVGAIGLVATGITLNWGTGTYTVGNRTLAKGAYVSLYFTADDVAKIIGDGIT